MEANLTPPLYIPPTVTDFHPVHFNYWIRYQEILSDIMGGPHASLAFSPIVSMADVHWRFIEATGQGIMLSPEDMEQWKQMAFIGSSLSLSLLLGESLDRSESLHIIHTIGDVIANPGLSLKFKPEHPTQIEHVANRTQRNLEQIEFEEIPHSPSPQGAQLNMGIDWQLRGPSDPPELPLLSYNSYFYGNWHGAFSLRADVRLLTWVWSVNSRLSLYRNLSLIGSLRSPEPDPEHPLGHPDPLPWQSSLGLNWEAPGLTLWGLRLERVDDLLTQEWRYQLRLQGNFHTPIPGRPGTPAAPSLPERGPLITSNNAGPR